MKRLLTILLLAAGTAHGQINNPVTAGSLGLGWSALTNAQSSLYSGTATQLLGYVAETNPSGSGLTGFNVMAYTNTNTLVIPANLLIAEDAVPAPRNARNVTVQGLVTIQAPFSSPSTIYANNSIAATDASTYTNTLLTWSSNTATFATNVSVAGSLTVGSFTTTTPSTWALDATQTAAATNGRLTLPSNANVIRLTNNNAISSVTNGVLGAFYYLVNQATNAVTISNVGGITIDGAQNLTLSPNESATLIATGATNVSVANRGDLTDVALGGTANTAPSQTASSGSSLMTRQLSDDRYSGLNEVLEELSRPPMTLGATIVEAANSGSGFIAWTRQQNQVAQLNTTVATNSPAGYSRAGFYQWAMTAGAHANTPLSRGWTCGFILNSQTDSVGGLSTSIGFGVPTAYQGGALTNRGLRVTFTGNGTGHTVTAAAHNGTNEVVATNSIASGGMEAGTVVRWTPVNAAGVATTNSTLAVYGRATNGSPVLITQLTLTNSIGASQAVGSLLAFVAHSSTNSPTYVANFEISGFTTKWH